MTLTQWASQYLALNILVVATTVISFLLYLVNHRFRIVRHSQELKFNYILLTMVVALSILQLILPKREFFKPPVKVWSATSSSTFNSEFGTGLAKGYMSLDFIGNKPVINTQVMNDVFWVMALLVVIFGVYRLITDLKALLKITGRSFLIRKYRTVHIYSSDLINVPFSFWIPARMIVVIPNRMFGAAIDLRMAILHELQHHRQRDTYWVHFLWVMRILCCWNPAIYFWNKLFCEIQEFACDEALVDLKKVSSHAYASCLVRVAETAVNHEQGFVCATGLTFMADRHTLKRRITTMLAIKEVKMGRTGAVLISFVIFLGLTGIALASQSLIQDRRVTLKEAQAMLVGTGEFPVVVNDLVLKQLNRFIGTPEGREYMRKSLDRMEHYKVSFQKKLSEYGAPEELLAVPIIESGYQNLEAGSNSLAAAGLWQFIPPTARNYGLQVDDAKDDRLDADLLTDAAMRYLTANKLRFKDWGLSVFAFNIGESKVQEAINKTGSRDVWALIHAGYEGDADYVPKLMAAILIMRNPSSVQQ